MEKAKFENRTYYDLLGIRRKASLEEIKRAYHELARRYHPDVKLEVDLADLDGEELSKTRKFKILTFAYHTLTNPALRAEYDQSLPPEWDYGVSDSIDDGEIFSAEQYQKKAANKAFGVFGEVEPITPMDAPEEADEQDETAISLADRIRAENDVWGKIKSLFRKKKKK